MSGKPIPKAVLQRAQKAQVAMRKSRDEYRAAERSAAAARSTKDHVRKVYGPALDRMKSLKTEYQELKYQSGFRQKPNEAQRNELRRAAIVKEYAAAKDDFRALRRQRSREQNWSGLQRTLFG